MLSQWASSLTHFIWSPANQLLTATATGANMAQDLKPAGDAAVKVKPCCVCKEEKASRDECMLFSNAPNPQKDCATTIDKYKSCMAGFGFKLP
ncbi:cytochrome c oxidase copper chaperone protein [Drepanopeziza brunnea f. sp. 'multigermtubi' MB_m1]|uniref:Cytochrome c oxidase copper chaperone protein n=1 Tax=Marssonina brunnea f. sp. multigermtubi (strain MB_m1) TaxID=1072389 RepID=K1XDW0_MARBU|nr:cytochrome c oxidase copper chaperone protein [Drepanopeziza brunnea f. sp. 'multigermtubi' MB_m1]EKD19048.1 cytochrome c oxidase copper chaperone protein [Drepanopeziza brunnea f. sp. 'multigermtubi' MB_m1]